MRSQMRMRIGLRDARVFASCENATRLTRRSRRPWLRAELRRPQTNTHPHFALHKNRRSFGRAAMEWVGWDCWVILWGLGWPGHGGWGVALARWLIDDHAGSAGECGRCR